jgi:site-specific DNA recombinase
MLSQTTQMTIDYMVYRAAIYARVSTDKQEEDGTSLVTQVQKCLEYCWRKGYVVAEIHIYREVWTGAEYRERPLLSKLREAARNREFDVVVFYAFDRLSRNQVHQAVIIDDLQYNGVGIECVTENFDDSPLGKFMRSAHGFAAELEREKFRERSYRGMMERFQNGQLAGGGQAAYGYRWNEDRTAWLTNDDALEVDGVVKADEAGNAWTERRIVERVFNMVDGGMSNRGIADTLTAEGIPTRRGGTVWQLSTLNKILNNPCYMGHGVAYKWRDIKRPGRAPKLVRRPAEEHIPLPEGTIPAIIDQALFDRVQQKMQRNKELATRNNRHADQALLRCGLVVCGNCGEVMHVQQLPAGPAYTCRKAAGKPEHTSPGIKVELLDDAAWRFVTESLKDQAMIERRVEAIKAAIYDGTQQELEPVEREINRLAEEQANLALAIGNIDRTRPEHIHAIKSLTVLLEQSSAAMQQLEGERRAIIEQRENIAKLEAQLEKYKQDCIAIGKGLKEIHDYQGKRGILEFLGFRATVWEYRHDPRYKFELVPPVLRPQWERDGNRDFPDARGNLACLWEWLIGMVRLLWYHVVHDRR